MKAVTKYVAENGAVCNTAEEALKEDYIISMDKLGFNVETSLKIFDKINDIKSLIDTHDSTITQIKLDRQF